MTMSEHFDTRAERRDDEPAQEPTVSEATVERTFAVGSSARLFVDNPRGQIRVTAWDRPEIRIEATKRPDCSRATYEATQVIFQQQGDDVLARTLLDRASAPSERFGFPGLVGDLVEAFSELVHSHYLPAPVRYVVQVPRHASLMVKGVACTVEVEGTTGGLHARTVSGSLALDRVQGDLHLATVSGGISAEGAAGRVEVDSVSGEIRLAGQVASLRAKTVSGEIELASPLVTDAAYDFQTVSGNVVLRVPATTGATLSLRGVSARAESDVPCVVLRNVRRPGAYEWDARLNDGGARVSCHTVSGCLRVAASDSAPPAPETTTPQTEPVASEEVSVELRVLQALERGEISVDEAVRLLDSLRRPFGR